MRHRKSGRKLNRTSAHRTAMLRNLACNLFLTAEAKGDKPWRISTTLPKAKEGRRLVERCITLAKRAVRTAPAGPPPRAWASPPVRRLHALLVRRDAVRTLLEKVAPLYNDRPGGYTRILRLARRRLGDGADLCYFELVTEPVEAKKPVEPVAPKRPEAPPAPAAETPAAPAESAPAAEGAAGTSDEAAKNE